MQLAPYRFLNDHNTMVCDKNINYKQRTTEKKHDYSGRIEIFYSISDIWLKGATNHRFSLRSIKTTLPRYQPASLPPLLSCHTIQWLEHYEVIMPPTMLSCHICSDRGVPSSSGHFIRNELISPRPKFYIQPTQSQLSSKIKVETKKIDDAESETLFSGQTQQDLVTT